MEAFNKIQRQYLSQCVKKTSFMFKHVLFILLLHKQLCKINVLRYDVFIEDVYVFIYLANEIFLQILKYSSIIYYIISIISQWMRIKSSKKFSNIFKTKPFARCLWTCLTFLFLERWKSGVKIQSSKEIKCREYFLQVVSSYNKRKQSITYLLTLFWLIS